MKSRVKCDSDNMFTFHENIYKDNIPFHLLI